MSRKRQAPAPATAPAPPPPAVATAPLPTPAKGARRSATTVRVAGLLLLALGGLGLWYVGRCCRAEWDFRNLAPDAEQREGQAGLNAFAEQLNALLERDPTNGELRARYANLLGRLGRRERAISELERALRLDRAQNSLSFLAEAYEKLGQYDRAREVMTDQVAVSPSDIAYNRAWLRLLNRRVQTLKAASTRNAPPEVAESLRNAQRTFGKAVTNWLIRAPEDPNSHLFAANYYVEPLYAKLSYLSFLTAFAQLDPALAQQPAEPPMIALEDARGTVRQILQGHYARAYRGLP